MVRPSRRGVSAPASPRRRLPPGRPSVRASGSRARGSSGALRAGGRGAGAVPAARPPARRAPDDPRAREPDARTDGRPGGRRRRGEAGALTPRREGRTMERTEGRLVQVEIYGQSYNLRGEGETGYIQDLASYVDRKMREVSEATATVDSLKVAILAALNIADESRRGVRPDPGIMKGGPDRVARLIDMLERCFADA